MTITLSDDAKRLIDAPNCAHLTTLMEDGQPKAEPVWVGRDGDRIVIATDRKSIKSINIDRDPRVALSITDYANPYEQLLIRGRVVEARRQPTRQRSRILFSPIVRNRPRRRTRPLVERRR